MANTYDIGDGIRLSGAFTVSDVATDPTTITLKIKDAADNTASYTYALTQVSKSSTGSYYKDISLSTAGRWFYRWEGTGTVVAACEKWFTVRLSEFT